MNGGKHRPRVWAAAWWLRCVGTSNGEHVPAPTHVYQHCTRDCGWRRCWHCGQLIGQRPVPQEIEPES